MSEIHNRVNIFEAKTYEDLVRFRPDEHTGVKFMDRTYMVNKVGENNILNVKREDKISYFEAFCNFFSRRVMVGSLRSIAENIQYRLNGVHKITNGHHIYMEEPSEKEFENCALGLVFESHLSFNDKDGVFERVDLNGESELVKKIKDGFFKLKQEQATLAWNGVNSKEWTQKRNELIKMMNVRYHEFVHPIKEKILNILNGPPVGWLEKTAIVLISSVVIGLCYIIFDGAIANFTTWLFPVVGKFLSGAGAAIVTTIAASALCWLWVALAAAALALAIYFVFRKRA